MNNNLKDNVIQKMENLVFPDKIITDYKDKGIVYISEETNDLINMCNAMDNTRARDCLSAITDLLDAEVYHIIKTNTDLGESWYFLYLSSVSENNKGEITAYCYFPDSPINSDFGEIFVKVQNTGIILSEQSSL